MKILACIHISFTCPSFTSNINNSPLQAFSAFFLLSFTNTYFFFIPNLYFCFVFVFCCCCCFFHVRNPRSPDHIIFLRASLATMVISRQHFIDLLLNTPWLTASLSGDWVRVRHPSASTVKSQLQDGDCTDGWQNLTTQQQAPCSWEDRHLSNW